MLIASPDAKLRAAYARALKRSYSIEVRGGRGGLEEGLRELKPAILLLDLGLRRLGGLGTIKSLLSLSPCTKIITITDRPKLKDEVNLILLGAKGYVSRNVGARMLNKAVRTVGLGEFWIGHKVIPRLLERIMFYLSLDSLKPDGSSSPASWLADLSERKKEVLHLLARGLSNQEIAARMGISRATVKAHLAQIYENAGVRNRVQLVRLLTAQP